MFETTGHVVLYIVYVVVVIALPWLSAWFQSGGKKQRARDAEQRRKNREAIDRLIDTWERP